MKVIFNELLNQSFVSEKEEDDSENWLIMIMCEYEDDNEGLTKEEFFKSHWQRFFPLDLDFMSEDELVEFEKFLLNYF